MRNNVIFLFVLFVLFVLPVGHSGIHRVHAQYSVHVVQDSSPAGTVTPIKTSISASQNIQQTYYANQDYFKEKVLDPLLWQLANSAIQNMLTSLTRWVNSGFEGEPAFVTDLDQFLLDAADEAAGEFLKGAGLGFLCSPFSIDVRTALNVQYYQAKTYKAQCTLSDITTNIENFLNGDFTDGSWAAWFELTQGTHNDPNRAFLESRARLFEVVLQTQGREITLLEGNNFFKNIEFCEEVTDSQTGKKHCVTTTPGNIIQSQLNSSLDAQKQRLVFADEFDELLTALFSQFANQAIVGTNGLLGLGGSSYTDYSYGSTGNLSYLDAVAEEQYEQTIDESSNLIEESIDRQYTYIALQQEIVNKIDQVEEELLSAEAAYPSCFNVRMSPELTDIRDDAEDEIKLTQTTVEILTILNEQFLNARTPEEELDVMLEYRELETKGFAALEIDIAQTELDLEYTFPPKISSARSSIQSRRNYCEDRSNRSNSNTTPATEEDQTP